MLQGLCSSLLFNGNDNANANATADNASPLSAAPFGNVFMDPRASPTDRQHDVWGSSVFSLPELGGDLPVDFAGASDLQGLLGGSSPLCTPILAPALGDTQDLGIATDVKPMTGQRIASLVSTSALSVAPSMNGCNAALTASSVMYTPQTNQLSFSSLMSTGNPVGMPSNGPTATGNSAMNCSGILNNNNNNNNNNTNSNVIGGSYASMPAPNGGANTLLAAGAYQQNPPMAPGLGGGIPTFFTTAAQGGGNVMMFAPSSSGQTLCVPAGGGPGVFPYFVFSSPPQPGLDVSGAVAYSQVAAAAPPPPPPPPMGTVMCGPAPTQGGAAPSPSNVMSPQSMHPMWALPTVQAMQGVPQANFAPPAPIATGAPSAASGAPAGVPTTTTTTTGGAGAGAGAGAGGFATTEANPAVVTAPLSVATGASESNSAINNSHPNGAAARGPRGSPPSYDSLRLQLVKRRPPPGRQRSGTNVHGSLQGICAYYSYNLSAALKQYEQPDARPSRPGEQVLPVFIQMFPCELRDRTIVVLNRVVLATCGPDIATVVGIEPRSETSFIALVRTNALWQLIHKLRCRVLMDRHGFWYAEDMDQYMRLKEYCENVRRLPQQTRHFQTDGLPCMPLVVELSRSVNASAVTSSAAPRSFDEVAPIATVERHLRLGTAGGSNDGDSPRCDSPSLQEGG